MKKLVSIFLVLALVIFQVDTAKVFADTQSGDFNYTTSGTTASITKYTGSGGIVVIPDKIDGYTVTSINDFSFINCSSITSITIPNSVSSIGYDAFAGCSSLTSITIPSSVSSIGDDVFSYCPKLSQINVNDNNINYISLNGVLYNKDKTTLICYPSGNTSSKFTIPTSVTRINDFAFNYCSSITSITIPNSVSSIGDNAFSSCSSLTSITIPSSVSSIGDDAFSYCPKLSQINVNDNNINYISLNGVLYNKDKTTLICYPSGNTSSKFTIPTSVTRINHKAFALCFYLTSITIPNSVSSIGYGAFYCCSNLSCITIPNSVSSIDVFTFASCSSLTSITIPNSVTNIRDYAFDDCTRLTSITIPNSVSSIGQRAFDCCFNLTSITIPSSVSSIGNYAFDECSSNLIIYYHNTAIGFTNPWNGLKTVSGNIVSYNGNGNTSGTVPVDNNVYVPESKASILNNTSNLVKTGYVFAGWNTAADGSGTSYPTDASISMNGTDITLYAQWKTQIISPTTGTFTKAAPNDLKTTITAPNKLSNPITGVYNGLAKLTGGIDEAVTSTNTGYTLTLFKSYLSKLNSNSVITVKFKDGSSLKYNVVLGSSISPTTGTFKIAAPTDLIAAITAPDKLANPVTGVYNGATKLIGGTDEAVLPTTTGYTLTLFKSYLSKLNSNSVITVKFKDGSSLNYTVVLVSCILPTTETFTKAAPTDLRAEITTPNKLSNPVTGVYNGDNKLIGGTDEAITSTGTGYNLTLFKSYLSKLTSNSIITVKFKDGSSLNYTVNIK